MKSLNLFKSLFLVATLLLGVGNAWAGANAYMSARSADPAQGLVYSSTKSNAPSTDKYQEYYPGGCVVGTTGTDASPANKCYYDAGDGGGPHTTYAWAKPARGYKFKQWKSGYATKMSSEDTQINTASDRSSWNGEADLIKTSAGGKQCTYYRPLAEFEPATSYTITYAKPVGGSYTVGYSYLKTRERSTAKFYNASGTQNAYKDYEFYTDNSESYSLSPSSDGNQAVTSYADDAITMTASGANFVGWYEGSTQKSTSASYTSYKANANVTITALFKTATLGTATGDLSPVVNAGKASELTSLNGTATVPVTAYGSWTAGDFTVTFTEKTSRGDITKGTVTYAKSTGNDLGSTGTLTIPFTFNPSSFGGTEVEVTVTPVYGDAKTFTILASANKVLNYEACILLEGESEPQEDNTGTLAAMVAKANTMDSKPTVQLAKDKSITSPLSLQKSMKFDLNDKKITSTGTSAFSIDAAGIDVQIVDDGFGGIGEITTQSAQSGNVSVVTFTQKAKLTMQGGTLSAKNTGSGSAYGINVTQGSTFYMTNGQLTVTAASGSAEGVHVATASDYATLNGGSVTVSAPSNAYGLWSAGQSNITDATIDVETTTGTSGYGFYVNGGVTTLTEVATTVSVKTAGAGGGFVKAGRLNVNGGSIAVTAETSDVYGVYVAAGATANIQQNAIITAQATGASGTKVFGINNLGTVSLTNVSVTATSPTTAATAVNTATSATSTTINGGTYRANTTGGTAYGLHHQYGTLNVDGGEFKAVGSGNSIYGARATVDATIANATLWGETQGSGNTAYGFVGGVANKNITLTNCTITGLSVTSKAYAIYSRANVTATGCTLTATTTGTNEAYGLYAENGTNQLINTDATVTSNTIQAYGINHLDGSLTISGGRFEVTAEQKTAGADEESKLYGIYNAANKTTTVSDAEFIVRATNSSYAKYMYGAYTLGTLNSTSTVYDVKGKIYARGIYNSGTLNLQNNTITAENTNGSDCYGIYATNKFAIDGDEVFAKSNLKTVYAMTFGASADGDVLAGKFYATGNGTNDFGAITKTGTIGKVRLKGGVYKTVSNLQRYAYTGLSVFNIDDIHPDYTAGYRYTIAAEAPSPYVCYIKNGNKYETLAAALQYTKDNSGNFIIIMSQNHTLPAGDYELPSNATLIVPYKAGKETLATAPVKRNTAGLIEEHIRLTLASGANLNVSGKIEVGGELYCVESGLISYNNSPYAHIRMEEGSLIQLNSGAKLYAWGFITGAGNITVKNGAEVHEMFQVGDMPAMSPLVQYYNNNSHKFFPLNQYFIQNIEAQTTYYYGSKLICSFSNYYTGSYNGDDNIKLVGTEGALFLITSTDESSWVRKSYDAAHDYQVWEVNSDIKLGSLSLSISGYSFNSANYILPVTSNMKIHVLDGDFAITQSTQFLPGTQVEVNKTASLKVNSGQKVYFFDKDQWSLSAKTIAFSPSWTNGNKPSRTSLFVDAALNVHGKINVQGSLYTSNKGTETSKTDGANIYSTNADAGTVSYNAAAPSATTITLMTGAQTTKVVNMESAKLKNNDGSYTETAGAASGEAYIYLDNVWQKTYTNGCFEVIGSTVYAKPSEYVALQKSQTVGGKLTGVEEKNHTYLTADDKILILMDECQWWEVVATSDPAVFECKKEGYEGFYRYNTTMNKWELIVVTVTFYANETGNTVLKNITTNWKGIPDQSVIATNPSKATTDEFTYDFYGWKSSVTEAIFQWTATLEEAEADMSYRPVFTEKKRNYSITLIDANNGNVVVETPYGEKPVYTPKKDATAQYTYSFREWSPALANVTGTATYTALWDQTLNKYNITWKDGENTLEVDENQDYGTATAYNGTLPTKAADNEYAYTFSKWKSSLNGNSYNNGSTPTVAGETTYEAQYTTTPRYKVTFNNYDAELTSAYYTQGETPAYDGVPARKRDDNGYYKFIGWKNGNGDDYATNVTLPAVTKKETYTAQYEYVTDLFTITLKNIDGNDGVWSGKFGEGSTPFYNPNNDDVPVTPTKAGNAQYEYVFDGWALTKDGAKLNPVPAVTAEATYWARFNQTARTYDITYNLNGGSNTYGGYTPATSYTYGVGASLPPAANMHRDGYSFGGWFANSGCTGSAVTSVSTSETGNKEFWAKWTENLQTVNVAYKCGETSIQEGISVANVGVATTKNVTAPAITGYTFLNWLLPTGVTTSSVLTNSTITIQATAADKTITANYKLIDYTITHGAAAHGNYTIKVGSAAPVNGEAKANVNQIITLETMHIDEGYRLGAWNVTAGGNPVEVTNNQFTMPAANVTISPTFVKISTLTIGVNNVEYGSVSHSVVANVPFESSVTVNNNTFTVNGTTVTATPTANTAQYTYEFDHWENLPNNVVADVPNIQAVFTRTLNTYTVTFNDYNGSELKKQTVDWNTAATAPADPSRDGYDFTGWDKAFNAVTADLVVTAQYSINQYTISFDSNGGSSVASITQNYGTAVTAPADPTREGYTFNGWLPTVPSTMPASNTECVAQWTVNQYTISFDSNGGSSVASITQNYGTTVTAPADPTREGYTFNGWLPTVPSTMPASNTECVAQWTVNQYTISFDSNGGSSVASITQNYGTTVTAPADPTREGYTFNGWSPAVPSTMPLNGTTCVAQWTQVVYNITYNLDGGSVTLANPENYTIESTAITLNNPTKAGHTFAGWTGTGLASATKTVTIAAGSTGDRSYTATWTAVMDVLDVKTPTPIDFDATVTTTIVRVGGVLEVSASKKLTTGDLILEASEGASGEIAGDVQATNAYFHFTREGGFKARTWYAVAVPWKVYVAVGAENNGVYIKKKGGSFEQQILGTTYDLIYYDGKSRAQGKVKSWSYVEDDQNEHGEHIEMRPGCAYMIYLTSDADTIRFKSSEAAPLHKDVDLYTWPSSIDDAYAHWNGIANPATYHAYLYVYATHDKGQVYNADTKGYDLFDMKTHKLVVGQPIFIQTTSGGGNVKVNRDEYSLPSSAPRRRAKEQVSQTQYELMLAASEADVTDRVIVCLDEDKEKDVYTVGHDLVKMGVSDIVPQMWINRYEKKMCINTVAGFDDTADYPLGIFAPKDGEYDLFIEDQPDNESMLYLTYDGAAIWNLSFGGYVANLNKGTNTHYGLRIVRKAPQITTGFDEAVVDAKGETHKVVINDQVYIIRNGEIYSVTGQKAK